MPSRQEWREKGADMTTVMLVDDHPIFRQGLRSQTDLIRYALLHSILPMEDWATSFVKRPIAREIYGAFLR